jgi:hypothetical protein
MNTLASTQLTKRKISELLDGLPPESLKVVEQFVRFLYQQEPATSEPRYATAPAPTSSLDAWTVLLLEGYTGDALADTEALYDEV